MLSPVLKLLSPSGPDARLTTLIFHRVLPRADPLFPDEIDAQRFDAICSWVAQWFNVLPLDEAVQRLRDGELPARALAITFDDGYADNHDVALPILQRHGLSATFFIATGYLDGGRMWNDTVIESVRQCRSPTLDLEGIGISDLALLDVSDAAQRRAAIDAILMAIKYLPAEERLRLAERIAGCTGGARLPHDLMMCSDHVRALHRSGMQIGAHTVSHPILARLSDAPARAEIGDSKRWLDGLLDESVDLFAYPNGRPGQDFTDRDAALAREAGFTAAVSTVKGVAHAATDPYRIPRFTPWDRSKLRFGIRLATNLRSPVAEGSAIA